MMSNRKIHQTEKRGLGTDHTLKPIPNPIKKSLGMNHILKPVVKPIAPKQKPKGE